MKSIFVFLLILITSCGANNNYRESIDLALSSDSLLLQDRLDEAEILIAQAIKLDSNNHIAYNNLGVLKRKRGLSNKEVVEPFLKSLTISPDYQTAIYNLADFYSHIGDYSNSIVYCNRFLNIGKRNNEPANDMARIYTIRSEANNTKNQFLNAILDSDSALTLNPDSYWAYKERGSAYRELHKFDQAIENYMKAIEIKPDFAQAYNGLALCYDNGKKDLKMALQNYDKAISLNPESATYLYNRGACLFDNGFKEKALSDLIKADELGKREAKTYLQKY